MKKILTFLFCIFLIVFVAFVCVFVLSSKIKHDVNYFVKDGSTLSNVASDFKNISVISNKTLFKIYSKIWILQNGCAIIHVGEYKFHKKESYGSVLDKICNGKSVMKTITIPEGYETREIIDLLNKNKDLVGKNIIFFEEGKLLPESYSFKSGTKREIVFEKIQQDFEYFIKREWDRRDVNNLIKTPEEAVILASIVEKESKTDAERPVIANVYLNRMKIGMRLEADPTTIYEITKGKYKLQRLLTKKDLKIKGEYNTYRKKGLPIKPICNPGKKSILAVLHPAKTDYLYFVAREDLNGHYFSNNYKDHLKNIKYIKENMSAR